MLNFELHGKRSMEQGVGRTENGEWKTENGERKTETGKVIPYYLKVLKVLNTSTEYFDL
jgi:hypothetical protein